MRQLVREIGQNCPRVNPEQVAWAARQLRIDFAKDLETRSIIVNYANNARQKGKAPPGGTAGLRKLGRICAGGS
jgi:hypothetical protein